MSSLYLISVSSSHPPQLQGRLGSCQHTEINESIKFHLSLPNQ